MVAMVQRMKFKVIKRKLHKAMIRAAKVRAKELLNACSPKFVKWLRGMSAEDFLEDFDEIMEDHRLIMSWRPVGVDEKESAAMTELMVIRQLVVRQFLIAPLRPKPPVSPMSSDSESLTSACVF